MESDVRRVGYYSVLRWRSDATRDEAKNVAILLAAPRGEFGGIRHAPISTISSRLHEQGLLDAMLVGLEERFRTRSRPTVEDLTEMHRSLHRSLYLTEPKRVAVSDVGVVLEALYKAYVAPRTAGRSLTKGLVLDRVVSTLRRRGYGVRRGVYIEDFIFDAVVQTKTQRQSVVEVLSFASGHKNWVSEENDAGHFLYALNEVQIPGVAVIQPPPEETSNGGTNSYLRVKRWMGKAGVPIYAPQQLPEAEF